MELHIDKHGALYTVEFVGLLIVIFASFTFAAGQLELYLVPELPIFDFPSRVSADDFYIDVPKETPLFASKKDVLKKREPLVWEERDFLFVDVNEMTLAFYEHGTLVRTFPILAKPKEGGFFETPSGFYTIQAKAETHPSKLEKIKLPWTLYLYGNYVIHGVPVAANGRALANTTPGGGIRLSDADAKELFPLVSPGLQVLIAHTDTKTPVPFTYFRRTNFPHRVPEVTAASALAADLETGEILFEKNTNDTFPLASVSKLMTAVVALEHMDTDDLVEITPEALETYGNSGGFTKGEQLKMGDLLYGMILPSSNDAAKALELAVPNFIDLMNEKAQELGMAKTRYEDSSGLDFDNIASAADLFNLLQYIKETHADFLEATRTRDYSAIAENKKARHSWRNINWPAGDKRFLGGKAGWIEESLQTMAGVYAVRVAEYGARPVAVITLGSRNRVSDIRSITTYLESEFIHGTTLSQTTPARPSVSGGASLFEALHNLKKVR